MTGSAGLRAPHSDGKVVSTKTVDFRAVARSLMAKFARARNCSKISPGTPLPEGRFNWDVEDFNPEALKMSPCGQDGKSKIFDSPADETGPQGLAIPEKQLLGAVKLLFGEMSKEKDPEKACKKLDKDGKDGIDENEFQEWIGAQPFDQRVND